MNKKYIKGRQYEYKTQKLLENSGWQVIRSAGSKGPYDLVAIHKTDKIVALIQVKYNKKLKQKMQAQIENVDTNYKLIEMLYLWGKGR